MVDLVRIQTICQEHSLDDGMPVQGYMELVDVVKDLTQLLCPAVAKQFTMTDLNQRISSMARCPHKTIEKCIEFYLKNESKPLTNNGWIAGYVWSSRTILMYYVICKKMIDDPNKTSTQCAKESYKLLLKPYHNIFLRNLSLTALKFTPSKESLKFDPTELKQSVKYLQKWVKVIYTTHEKYNIKISY